MVGSRYIVLFDKINRNNLANFKIKLVESQSQQIFDWKLKYHIFRSWSCFRSRLFFTSVISSSLPQSTLILLENCSCCAAFHSLFTSCLLRFPSHTRSTNPPFKAISFFTLFAKSMASSFLINIKKGEQKKTP